MRKTKYLHICYSAKYESIYKTLLFITSPVLNKIYNNIGVNLMMEDDYNSFVRPLAKNLSIDVYGNSYKEATINIWII